VSTRVWYDPGTLARVPLGGGTPREILEKAYGADSSSGGSDLAVMQLRAATLDVQYPLGVTVCRVPLSEKPTFRIAPDGKTLAVTGRSGISLFRKGSQNEKAVAQGYQVSSLAWRSSRELLFSGYKPKGKGFGLFAASNTGATRPVTSFPYDFQIQDVWNGQRYLLKAQHDRSMTLFRPANGKERNLSWLDHTHLNGLMADGSSVLISEIGLGSTRPGSVYLRRTDGSPATKLGTGMGFALSPDGKWALVQPADKSELAIVPTAAGTTYSFELPRATHLQSARWFPDGSHIALNLQTKQGSGCTRMVSKPSC
jgi:hypothetical protein